MPIAVLIDHRCPAAVDSHTHVDEPVRSANLAEVAGNRIHHPKTLGLLSQVLGAICQQVPTAEAVVLLGAGEMAQLRGVEFFHRCVLLWLNDCSFASDALEDNRSLVTR